MLKKTELLSTTYTTNVGEIKIRYSVKQQDGEPVQSINATFTKEEVYAGTANIDADGAIGINLIKGMSSDEKKAVFSALVDNADEIFTTKVDEV